jgi:hypothetical protein
MAPIDISAAPLDFACQSPPLPIGCEPGGELQSSDVVIFADCSSEALRASGLRSDGQARKRLAVARLNMHQFRNSSMEGNAFSMDFFAHFIEANKEAFPK